MCGSARGGCGWRETRSARWRICVSGGGSKRPCISRRVGCGRRRRLGRRLGRGLRDGVSGCMATRHGGRPRRCRGLGLGRGMRTRGSLSIAQRDRMCPRSGIGSCPSRSGCEGLRYRRAWRRCWGDRICRCDSVSRR